MSSGSLWYEKQCGKALPPAWILQNGALFSLAIEGGFYPLKMLLICHFSRKQFAAYHWKFLRMKKGPVINEVVKPHHFVTFRSEEISLPMHEGFLFPICDNFVCSCFHIQKSMSRLSAKHLEGSHFPSFSFSVKLRLAKSTNSTRTAFTKGWRCRLNNGIDFYLTYSCYGRFGFPNFLTIFSHSLLIQWYPNIDIDSRLTWWLFY